MKGETATAIIISLDENTQEIVQLADTLGYFITKIFLQYKITPDVNYFIGSGKVEEINDYLQDTTIDLVIINGELKPSQWFVLEKTFGKTVYDRIRLILAIFEKRAERKEAQLQVKLAQLHYERPFVRELIHRARAGEHPGFMAGGEYQVDDYYEMIKKQMKTITKTLQKISINRDLQRKTRYKSGYYLVSLAGYTNAGKSSLLNLLSGEQVKVEGKLFSTLSTTTRRLQTKSLPILLTDTVGFIENLPSWIIDAFHSTLEELEVADVIVLVVDGSEPQEIVAKKLHVSLDELRELGSTSSLVLAFNKMDIRSSQEIDELLSYLQREDLLTTSSIACISVKEQHHIDTLLHLIYASLPNLVTLKLVLPLNNASQAFVSHLYQKTNVLHISYEKEIIAKIQCNIKIKDKILAQCLHLNGSLAQ